MNTEEIEIQIIPSKSILDLSGIFANADNLEKFKDYLKEMEKLKDSDIKEYE